jgi:DNA invertase Pin-like site-specific DNA recombinase
MKIGYTRLTKNDPKPKKQTEALEAAGCELVFTEQCSSESKQRPELERMFKAIKPGDTVIFERLDMLALSLKELAVQIERIKLHKAHFISLNENIDTSIPAGELAFEMIGCIAKFEQRIISERTIAGLDAARARGQKGGRRAKLSTEDIDKAQAMLLLDPELTKAEVAIYFNVSRPTLNKALNSTDTYK